MKKASTFGRAAALGRTLVQTLTSQRDLYTQLAELARQQSDFVAAGASEDLMTILAARSRLIDQLGPLDVQLQPFKANGKRFSTPSARTIAPPFPCSSRRSSNFCPTSFSRTKADRQALIIQKTDVGSQIGRAVTGSQLNRAYGAPARASPGPA